MTKIAKLLTVAAVVAAAGTFFTLNSSYEIICGNIEALTGGDTGSSHVKSCIVTMGRKATKQEKDNAGNGLETVLPQGFSEYAVGPHTIDGKTYNDCGTYTYGFVVYDKSYGQCVGWYLDVPGTTALGNWEHCPEHP